MAGRGRAGADGVLEVSFGQTGGFGSVGIRMEGMLVLDVLVGTLGGLVGRIPSRLLRTLQLQDGLLGDAVDRTVPSGLGIDGGVLEIIVIVVDVDIEGIRRGTGQR